MNPTEASQMPQKPQSAESAALDAAMLALDAMWKFAGRMTDKHGESGGDGSMTDRDHQLFQEAAGMSHDALRAFAVARNGAPAPTATMAADPDVADVANGGSADQARSHLRPTQR